MRRPLVALLLLPAVLPAPATQAAGAACVVAKQLGNSLAIEWRTGAKDVVEALEQARQTLRKRGFKETFPQANSSLPHGWLVVIETRYATYTGRQRTSYGCGFSPASAQDAERRATQNLRSYSWGWKPGYGYEVIERQQF